MNESFRISFWLQRKRNYFWLSFPFVEVKWARKHKTVFLDGWMRVDYLLLKSSGWLVNSCNKWTGIYSIPPQSNIPCTTFESVKSTQNCEEVLQSPSWTRFHFLFFHFRDSGWERKLFFVKSAKPTKQTVFQTNQTPWYLCLWSHSGGGAAGGGSGSNLAHSSEVYILI